MHSDEALHLFNMHAFKGELRAADYINLSKKIVATTGGLHLALEIIGSYLSTKKHSKVWDDTLEKLQKCPNKDVQDKLMISYNALDFEQQQIFLDIACFFIGTDKRIAAYMWKDCIFYPEVGVDVLLQRSLIKIGNDNKIWMHDQLRDLGREIVRNENIEKPGKRSRLWSIEDVRCVLENQEVTAEIKAIQFDRGIESKDYPLTREKPMDLPNVRFLRLDSDEFASCIQYHSKLSWLQWHCSIVMECRLSMGKLVILDLSKSNVTNDWSGWSSKQLGAKLKVLILDFCYNLSKTPELSELQKLERLSFEGCARLCEVGPSIGKLKKLIFLNLRNCSQLKELPKELNGLQTLVELYIDGCGGPLPDLGGLKKLELLSANGCKELNHIPMSIGRFTSLLELSLDESGVRTLPDSVNTLVKLKCLSLRGCRLENLSDSIGQLTSLERLFLSRSTIQALPISIGDLSNLQVLLVDKTNILNLPSTLGKLEKLEVIDASGCERLSGEISIDLYRLCSLKTLKLDWTNITMLPTNINGIPHLQTLQLENCNELQTLPQLPTSLQCLSVTCKPMKTFPDLSFHTNLLELRLINCNTLKSIPGFGNLVFLKILMVSKCLNLIELHGLEGLECLRELKISSCSSLKRLLDLPKSKHLKKLVVFECGSLQSIPNLSDFKMLRDLSLGWCEKLCTVEGLGELESLCYLDMEGCKAIENLPNLSKLVNLQELIFEECERLRTVEGLGELKSLCHLSMEDCKAIENLPNLSKLVHLMTLNLMWCEKLRMVEGLGELESLCTLNMIGYKAIENLPNLSNLVRLEALNLHWCEKLRMLEGLGELESLWYLEMRGCEAIENLPNLSKLVNLQKLYFGCEKLRIVEGLGELESLRKLKMIGCEAIENLPNLSKLVNLHKLIFDECEKLRIVEGLGELESLCELNMTSCKAIEKLPNLSKLVNLVVLSFAECEKLHIVEGLGELKSLRELNMTGCKAIENLPNMSNLVHLMFLNLERCEKLHMVEGLGELESLHKLNMTSCKAIKNLPNLSKLVKLWELILVNCKKLRELHGLEELKSLKRVDIGYSPSLYHYTKEWPHIPWDPLPRSKPIDLPNNYKVFLSFRGQDISDCLCISPDVTTFSDDGELGRDRLEAMNRSKISIPIFSKGYAFSIRCLQELAHIMECKKKSNQSVLPIFYDVSPDQVHEQSGSYEEAFKQHMNCYDAKMAEMWRAALREVRALNGWNLQHIVDEHKEILMRDVIIDVLENSVSKYEVGIEVHVEEVMKLLEINANDVRIIGIHGITSIGKTTLAKVIYNQLKEHFMYHKFLTNISETSPQYWGLKEFPSWPLLDIIRVNNPTEFEFASLDEGIDVLRHVDKKVLIVVDDVEERDQLDALFPYNGLLAPGSRVILTTRKKEDLVIYNVQGTYGLNELQFNDALVLFYKHAFKRSTPTPRFITLSREIVLLIGGFPLAMEVIGSFLDEKDEIWWEYMLKELKKVPHSDVQSKLMIVYENLNDEVQEAFLDIACFFIGTYIGIVTYMFKDYSEDGEYYIEMLRSLSLIKVLDNNELWMHNQLKDLGREIAQWQRFLESDKRLRLWHIEEAVEVLHKKPNMERIKAICLDYGTGSERYCYWSNQFTLLSYLEYLQLNKSNIAGDFGSLLLNLKILRWHYCPSELLTTNLYLPYLLVLELSNTDITDDWNGWSFVQMSSNLEVLIVKSCRRITRTPNVFDFPWLSMLILDDCTSLIYVDPSIGGLTYLRCLSLKSCKSLRELPSCIGGFSLLEELDLSDMSIDSLPDSIGELSKLKVLNMCASKLLRKLPSSIGGCRSLKKLDFSYTSIDALPDSIGELEHLEVLNMFASNIKYLPRTLGKLEKLQVIDVSYCRNLHGEIVLEPMRLTSLREFIMVGTNITLPPSISGLLHLRGLNWAGCYMPRALDDSDDVML